MRPAAGTPANHERRFRALGGADQVAAGRRTDARRLAGGAHGRHRAGSGRTRRSLRGRTAGAGGTAGPRPAPRRPGQRVGAGGVDGDVGGTRRAVAMATPPQHPLVPHEREASPVQTRPTAHRAASAAKAPAAVTLSRNPPAPKTRVRRTRTNPHPTTVTSPPIGRARQLAPAFQRIGYRIGQSGTPHARWVSGRRSRLDRQRMVHHRPGPPAARPVMIDTGRPLPHTLRSAMTLSFASGTSPHGTSADAPAVVS